MSNKDSQQVVRRNKTNNSGGGDSQSNKSANKPKSSYTGAFNDDDPGVSSKSLA